MYTLRSKVLEESVRSEPSSDDEEMDFAPLISRTEMSLTDEVDVEEARAAADAEINKLQSQYLSEAMTQTVSVAVLDEPAFPETIMPGDNVRPDSNAMSEAPNHKALVALLAMTLIITFGVVLYRVISGDSAEQGGAQATSAVSAGGTAVDRSPPAALPTPPPSTEKSAQPTATKASVASDPRQAAPEPVKTATPEPVKTAAPEAVKTATPGPVKTATPELSAEAAREVSVEPAGIGQLGVRPSTPSSVVYIDGKRVGKTPLMPIELAAGEHIVRLECATDGIKASKSIPVNIEVGKTLKLGKYDFTAQEWK
jgi:serine/threonine-protein kinase